MRPTQWGFFPPPRGAISDSPARPDLDTQGRPVGA